MSNEMTIKQASDELGVSIKTLRRWEEKGMLIPERDEKTKTRLYHPYLIEYWKRRILLSRKIRDHLKLLEILKKELDEYPIEQTYTSGKPLKPISLEMLQGHQRASEDMDKWNEEYKKLLKELAEYPNIINKAIEDLKETEK
ncbi:MerR family DNA-binding transcriptional regulator [Candidatus Microgenomates bacterium]|nr:MAG: MerR family DNA-binding transcriptional regulator [Candidatus Microgenomates bacterium]